MIQYRFFSISCRFLDNSLRDIQDKILDVLGPLCALHENFMLMQESIENEEIILDKATVDAMFGCVKKAIMLVGDTSTQVSSKRREQVLTKLNPVLASLGKEDFPDSGKQLFGDGFESRLKPRSETANTVADAKKAGKSFFRGTAPRRFHGRFRGGRGQYRAPYRGFFRPTSSYQTTRTFIQGQEQSPIYPVSRAISAKTTSIVLARPSHLPSGMFKNLFEFPQRPASDRPIETFFSNMGTDYKGPLGPPSSLGLSNRVSSQSCTTKYPSSYPMFIGTSILNRSGGLGTVIERGSPFRSTRLSTRTRIHQLLFCNTQKGWGPQTSDKSKTPKLFHPIQTLQSGVHTHVKKSFKERGLHGKNRPQRCISDSPNMAESPKVPKVSVEGFSSGIRMPLLRFSKCPEGIHKIVKTSVVYSETRRNSPDCIPR